MLMKASSSFPPAETAAQTRGRQKGALIEVQNCSVLNTE